MNYRVEDGHHTLTLSGESSSENYQSILRSLTYINTQPEPLGASRNVEIVVRDSVQLSQPLLLTIEILLLNDNCPIISFSRLMLTFTEGSVSLAVGSEAGLLVQDDDFQFNSSIQRVLMILGGFETTSLERLDINNTATLVFSRISGLFSFQKRYNTYINDATNFINVFFH